ncbi:MAG TPA: ComEC/Rec2 family competence protein, partial [Acidimicrobiia bacterium]|nr:ComEC/Rec2 family competence protein [Acidimicrobiia bacterium]
MTLPGVRSRLLLALAATTWAAAVVGRWWGTAALAAVLVAAVSLSLLSPDRRLIPVVCLLVLVGWWSGHASLQREAAVLAHQSAEGRVEMGLRLLDDPRLGPYGWWVMAVADPPETGRPPSVPMLLSFDDQPDARAGDRVVVEGRRRDRSGRVRGKPYAGSIQVESIRGVTPDPSPWWKAGNAVRTRVLTTLGDEGEERALLAGFLVGEVSGVSEADMEAMRRSGLSHLVAVSGSNVALFLTLAMLAAGPLASGPRRRAVLGLAALVVFVVATRWEPSVVRASVMAALMLTGRVAGWAFDASAALGITVIGLIATFGHLATDVGFAMSVLATAGVLLGSQVPLRPPAMGRLVGATASAQLAVAPIVLAVFGSIPLLAPLTNLLAIPLVSAASALGAAGVATGSPIL